MKQHLPQLTVCGIPRRYMNCNKFLCKYLDAGRCECSEESCIVAECKGVYGNCIFCMQSECVFRKEDNKKIEPIDMPQTVDVSKAEIGEPVRVYAYVDGSYNNRTKTYGYGAVVSDKEGIHELSDAGKDEGMAAMRNVGGEISGAMAAMQYAMDHEIKEMDIYYDYTGIEKWAKHEWSANKRETIAYQRFCEICPVKVNFIKVKGHSGVEGNDRADWLAKKAVGVI